MNKSAVGMGLVLAALFLLPWQTRWIFAAPTLNGGAWEYGVGSVYAVELLVLVAALFGDRNAIFAPLKRLGWPLAALTLSLVVSALLGPSPLVSLGALMHLAFAVLFCLVLAAAIDPSHPKDSTDEKEVEVRPGQDQVVVAFLAGLVPAAALGWFQTLSGSSPAFKWLGLAEHLAATPGVAVIETAGVRLLRAYGPFPHPNVFGGFLVFGILVSLWLGTRRGAGTGRGQILNTAAAAILSATLVITFSRSAMLGLLLALVVAGAFAWQRRSCRKNWAFMGMLAGLIVAGVWFRGPLLSRADLTNRLETASLAERGSQYAQAAAVLGASPLFGTGIGAYTAGLARAFPGFPSYAYQPIHNAPILFLAEIGIAGLLAAAWLVGRLKTSIGPWSPDRRRAFWILFAFLLPLALADHYLWSSWAGLALCSLVFVGVSILATKSSS